MDTEQYSGAEHEQMHLLSAAPLPEPCRLASHRVLGQGCSQSSHLQVCPACLRSSAQAHSRSSTVIEILQLTFRGVHSPDHRLSVAPVSLHTSTESASPRYPIIFGTVLSLLCASGYPSRSTATFRVLMHEHVQNSNVCVSRRWMNLRGQGEETQGRAGMYSLRKLGRPRRRTVAGESRIVSRDRAHPNSSGTLTVEARSVGATPTVGVCLDADNTRRFSPYRQSSFEQVCKAVCSSGSWRCSIHPRQYANIDWKLQTA